MFDQKLITANKYLVKQDAELVDKYLKRRNWQPQDCGGGLKLMITKHGSGDSIIHKPDVQFAFRVELLDGTLCYSSETEGKKKLIFGSGELEPGLIKAFARLKHGDQAVFILPPHLAKGLLGDLNKIPPHSVIVYYADID